MILIKMKWKTGFFVKNFWEFCNERKRENRIIVLLAKVASKKLRKLIFEALKFFHFIHFFLWGAFNTFLIKPFILKKNSNTSDISFWDSPNFSAESQLPICLTWLICFQMTINLAKSPSTTSIPLSTILFQSLCFWPPFFWHYFSKHLPPWMVDK